MQGLFDMYGSWVRSPFKSNLVGGGEVGGGGVGEVLGGGGEKISQEMYNPSLSRLLLLL